MEAGEQVEQVSQSGGGSARTVPDRAVGTTGRTVPDQPVGSESVGGGVGAAAHRPGGLVGRLRAAMDVVYREALKFGAVGAIAFVTDVGLFNLLTTSLWPGDGLAPLDGHEKIAKLVSAGTATLVAWIGNRYWTFRHRRQATPHRELAQFAFMNVVGMLIAIACLTISHDLLGFTSTLADNISGNVIGIGLGTLFRFWAYRRFVFTEFNDPGAHGRTGTTQDAAQEPAA